jgi:ATP-dependent helicase HepA
VARSGSLAEVEVFDAPTPYGIRTVSVAWADLSLLRLEQQARCWWRDEGRWKIGRVLAPPEAAASSYLVAVPGGTSIEIDERDLYVRAERHLDDPVALMAAGTIESRYVHERRQRFLQTVAAQRSKMAGLTGAMSSRVHLHRHQVGAAMRVLDDPVRRYLLADEVGLGKTIEAGMVIRETLVEDPGARVLVLVPDALVPQWEGELEEKFGVSLVSWRGVDVRPHSDVHDLVTEGPGDLDLLVVDEAHRLVSPEGSADAFEPLRGLALSAVGLLLLSATPVRSNESGFLQLLHLLDPEAYDLDDLEVFSRRVASRDAVATAVTLLAEDMPLVVRDEAVDVLRARFPDDAWLGGALDELEAAIDGDDEARGSEVAARVRAYVSERYRIHQRMIRTRRDARLSRTFPVRERTWATSPQVVDTDDRRATVVAAFDGLRSMVSADADLDGPVVLREVGARCVSGLAAVGDLAAVLGGDRPPVGPEAGLAPLIGHPVGEALLADLAPVLADDRPDERIAVAAQWAWNQVDAGVTLAAFTSHTSVARQLADHMAERYGAVRVASLVAGSDPDHLRAEVARAEVDRACLLLVCDSTAEEGWNLQFVDEVLHLDLPWSAPRLEQRLGRFDRLAVDTQRTPIRSVVVVDRPELEVVSGTWRRVLDEGFDVFRRSAASLQYVLPDVEYEALSVAVDSGFASVTVGLDGTRDRIEAVRREIEGQDMLDSVEAGTDDDLIYAAILDADDAGEAEATAIVSWLDEALRFRTPRQPPWRFTTTRSGPLLTKEQVRGLGTEALEQEYVARRDEAVGRRRVGLLRAGEPLVDRLEDLTLTDDRGTAFAARCAVPGMPAGDEPRPLFCFDVIIAVDGDAFAELSRTAVGGLAVAVRRALPTLFETVWWLPGGGEAPEPLVKMASSPRTRDLAADVDAAAVNLFGEPGWDRLCRTAEGEARAIALARPSVVQALQGAQARIDAAVTRAGAIALARDPAAGTAPDVERAAALAAVGRAMADPPVRIASCGVVFLVPPW